MSVQAFIMKNFPVSVLNTFSAVVIFSILSAITYKLIKSILELVGVFFAQPLDEILFSIFCLFSLILYSMVFKSVIFSSIKTPRLLVQFFVPTSSLTESPKRRDPRFAINEKTDS